MRQDSSHRLIPYGKMLSAPEKRRGIGGMAERLKAHVLKTCLGHTNVGSNPTPSAVGLHVRMLESLKIGLARVELSTCGLQIIYGEVPEWLNGLAC